MIDEYQTGAHINLPANTNPHTHTHTNMNRNECMYTFRRHMQLQRESRFIKGLRVQSSEKDRK